MESLRIEWIRERILRDEYLLTSHAEVERRSDNIDIKEIERVLLGGVILEDYPEDPRGASCLVCGSWGEIPVHVVCGQNSDDWLVVITVYIPSTPKWKNPQERSVS